MEIATVKASYEGVIIDTKKRGALGNMRRKKGNGVPLSQRRSTPKRVVLYFLLNALSPV